MSGKNAKRARRASRESEKVAGHVGPVKVAKRSILEMWAVLERLSDIKGTKDIQFQYGIARNKEKLRPEVKALEEARKPPEGYDKYEEARMALVKEHAKLNPETGEPLTYDEGRRIAIDPAKQKMFDKKVEALQKSAEHKEVVEQYRVQIDQYNEMLDEEIEVGPLHPMVLDLFPPDQITGRDLDVLVHILKE
jgi:hypothetical protein